MIGAARCTLMIAALVLTAAAAADVPSITVSLEDRFVEVGEPFGLSVKIEGDPVEDFVAPAVPGIRITQRYSTKKPGRPTLIEYVCIAEKAGAISIPPFKARVAGSAIESVAVEITVRDAEAGTRRKRSTPGSSEPVDRDVAQARQPTLEEYTFLRASVDKLEVYQGEGIEFDLSWWRLNHRNVNIAATAPPSEPMYSNFYSLDREDIPKEETSNGFPYEVHHFKRSLYPTQSGELTIPACEMKADIIVMSNFKVATQPVHLKTDPIAITVKPLPPRPANFNGAVGEFTFEVAPSESVHVQGVPFFLVARIAGKGNPDAIGEPVLPTLDWAQRGEPQSDVQQVSEDVWEKRFVYTITPLQTGSHSIDTISFCYFHPQRAEYVTLTAGPFDMPVADSPETQQHMVSSADIGRDVDRVSVLSEGLLPPDTLPDGLEPQRLSTIAFPVAAVVPPMSYVALALFLQRKRRFAADTAYSRAYHARQRAHEALGHAGSAADPVEALSRATTGYLADIRNLPPGSITSADAQAIVGQLRIAPETSERLLKVIRACERHRYAGAQLSGHEVLALVQAAEEAIDDVETSLRKERES